MPCFRILELSECVNFYFLNFFGFSKSGGLRAELGLECRAGVWTFESINWSHEKSRFYCKGSESFSAVPNGGISWGNTLKRLKAS